MRWASQCDQKGIAAFHPDFYVYDYINAAMLVFGILTNSETVKEIGLGQDLGSQVYFAAGDGTWARVLPLWFFYSCEK